VIKNVKTLTAANKDPGNRGAQKWKQTVLKNRELTNKGGRKGRIFANQPEIYE